MTETKVPEVDPATRIQQLKDRILQVSNKRIGAEKSLEILYANRDEKIAELRALGITSVDDLPAKIQELSDNMKAQLLYVEQTMSDIETKLSNLNG